VVSVPEPADARRPTVTITLVLHRSAGHLPACLRSVEDALGSGFADLIAVDNASPDDSAAIVRDAQPGALVLRPAENVGFAAACELARPHVRGRHWLLLNPDTELAPGSIAALAAALDAAPGVAAVSPWLRDADGAEPSYPGRRFPSAALALLELTRLHRLVPQPRRGRWLQGPYVRHGDPALRPDWLPGTALMLRRAAVDRVGGLDPSFFLYGEDLDWCWRARHAGWRLAVIDAIAVHREGSSARAALSEQAVQDRIASGLSRATARNGGRGRAIACAGLNALALTVEAHHRGRSAAARAGAGRAARAWRRALRSTAVAGRR
jgi:N-acetylglucosaminyl-diphospho-decaprenol L-rhamnosyltransferase